MPHVTVTIEDTDSFIADLRRELDLPDKESSARALSDYLRSVAGPQRRGYVRACIASATASQTVHCDQSDAVDGTDDITIAGQTISVEASPSGEGQMDSGTTDAEFADNLASKINAHSTMSKMVWADSDGVDTVTVYSVFPGPIGNFVALTETGNGFTLGGANLASGASDEVDGYELGYNPASS